MKELLLKRVAQNIEGTWGVLIDYPGSRNIPFALTAELPWKDNQNNISCIPAGEYVCRLKKRGSNKKLAYFIDNVPGRKDCLFHVANIPHKDLKGCIGIGEQFEYLGNSQAVLLSRKGVKEFMTRIGGAELFRLTIKECL